jgi:prepilin-type N-terminal cleavage/methylation domain-containing protein
MRRKGFTLVELLVVIAIIALLMGILMPALARVRQMAYRMVCGSSLSGIGKAMLVYSQDNNGDFPISGGKISPVKNWSSTGYIDAWDSLKEADAFPSGTNPTIGSCFYLLVKYADVAVKQFVCKGDVGSATLVLSDYQPANPIEDIEAWDFGTGPGIHNSYSYHMPFKWATGCTAGTTSFPISTASSPSSPVCADRNPYLDKNAAGYVDSSTSPLMPPYWDNKYTDPYKTGNASAHQREGQNVLYADISSRFQLYPNCGVANDNIYKNWPVCENPTATQQQVGTTDTGGSAQTTGTGGPKTEVDEFLVNEEQDTAKAPP